MFSAAAAGVSAASAVVSAASAMVSAAAAVVSAAAAVVSTATAGVSTLSLQYLFFCTLRRQTLVLGANVGPKRAGAREERVGMGAERPLRPGF